MGGAFPLDCSVGVGQLPGGDISARPWGLNDVRKRRERVSQGFGGDNSCSQG